MPIYLLIDCNAFYCSCIQIFQPNLRGLPVVTLSNNDGCVIARTREAKALGIKMGEPFHLNRNRFDELGVRYFSSNYPLFGDISERVMRTIAGEVDEQEIYSIDEAFCRVSGITDLDGFARRLKDMIWQRHGMAVGIGISTTKTLAKVANWRAKNSPRAAGVLDLVCPERRELLLRHTPIDEIWGIGRKLSERLKSDLQVETGWQLAQSDRTALQSLYGVTVVRTSRELMGQDCHGLELDPEPSKMIGSSKMFGTRVRDLHLLKQALATYTTRCAEKLRAQGSVCSSLGVSLSTSPHDKGLQHHGAITVRLSAGTSDTRLLVEAACRGLDEVFRPGLDYCRVGVIFQRIDEHDSTPADLFSCPASSAKTAQVMQTLDSINARFGRNKIHVGRFVSDPSWSMRANYMTPAYTTRWDELLKVH
ncbi:Y-family DNA polymerase [Pseudomonas juntendi]|uniref:Y-family DNA polymerase n=1 Tax=Pseudomonas TaxID=286 RepID=UPI0012AE33C4|nr:MULTISPECIES: Y-family DNA polymerase [Pseudomonas]MDG9918221.1 Y-family DNA polymerase [Pseudomonas juntendi]MDH0507669.1 Y-family DNA polymerase [Pseudomonas juntendi]MDH1044849.1 Y-family DNA polymerase [Pseudomonas juntendi]MRT62337.1 Y-family DNA polymerase [Pseudomonas sp. CAH-1]